MSEDKKKLWARVGVAFEVSNDTYNELIKGNHSVLTKLLRGEKEYAEFYGNTYFPQEIEENKDLDFEFSLSSIPITNNELASNRNKQLLSALIDTYMSEHDNREGIDTLLEIGFTKEELEKDFGFPLEEDSPIEDNDTALLEFEEEDYVYDQNTNIYINEDISIVIGLPTDLVSFYEERIIKLEKGDFGNLDEWTYQEIENCKILIKRLEERQNDVLIEVYKDHLGTLNIADKEIPEELFHLCFKDAIDTSGIWMDYYDLAGNKEKVRPFIATYCNNNNIAIGLDYMDENNEIIYDYARITVNVVDLPYLYAAIDTNNMGKKVMQFLFDNDFGTYIGESLHSGYCAYPVFKLNEELLYKINPEIFSEYALSHGKNVDLNEKLNNAEEKRKNDNIVKNMELKNPDLEK